MLAIFQKRPTVQIEIVSWYWFVLKLPFMISPIQCVDSDVNTSEVCSSDPGPYVEKSVFA